MAMQKGRWQREKAPLQPTTNSNARRSNGGWPEQEVARSPAASWPTSEYSPKAQPNVG